MSDTDFGHFVKSAGFKVPLVFPKVPVRPKSTSDLLRSELLRIYNMSKSKDGSIDEPKVRPKGHSISCFYYDKITGELMAVRCNCKEFHYLNTSEGSTSWHYNLTKEEIKKLTKKVGGLIKKTNQEVVSTPW